MKPEERIANWKIHPSIRGQFAFELYKQMAKNKDVFLLTGDLGYGMFDAHREDFPDRFVNCGAAEQAMIGIACGLAMEGKIPFVYSITNFLLYRPYEFIHNYISHEQVNVKLCGSGRDKDYAHDGISHDSSDVRSVLTTLPYIETLWPDTQEQVGDMVELMITNNKPTFISLRK